MSERIEAAQDAATTAARPGLRSVLVVAVAIALTLHARVDAGPDTRSDDQPPQKPRRLDRTRTFLHANWPVLSSYLLLVATVALAIVLRSDTGNAVAEDALDLGPTKVGGTEWQVWIATVSVGLAIAFVLAVHGIVRLARIPSQWPGRAGVGRRTVWLHSGAALVWVIGLGGAVGALVHQDREWPMDMEWRLVAVAAFGLLCATPWVAMTWLCHKSVHPYWVEPHLLRSELQDARISTRGLTATDDDIAALQQIWSQIVGIALAFATLVAISLVPTGALRNLWLSQEVQGKTATQQLQDSFTSTDVLLYGAMWALVAALVVIPLVASWRSTAQSVVDAAYPPNATTAADEAAKGTRDSLEAMLNLSSGILRNPLTVLTIATPLVTAALAAFVPEIGT
jgi:hypothetical protein